MSNNIHAQNIHILYKNRHNDDRSDSFSKKYIMYHPASGVRALSVHRYQQPEQDYRNVANS